MRVLWVLVIVLAAVGALIVARTYWRPLKWPAYAIAAWCVWLLIALPLSAIRHPGTAIGLVWLFGLLVLSAVVAVTVYGFVGYLLLRGARAIVRRLR